MAEEILGPGSETDQLIRRLEKENRKSIKTLKDIKEEYDNWYDTTTINYVLDNLQEEARKWIKELETDMKIKRNCNILESKGWYMAQIDWIKHFFNLDG